MNCADLILDSVDVANLAEVNLSDMVESGVNQSCELWEIDTRLDHDRQIDPSQIGDIDRVQNHICTIHGRPEAVRQ